VTTLIPLSDRVRVVWNITNACFYNCPHCAAGANCHLEHGIDKHAILQSLCSMERPLCIDFSGGDPLYMADDVKVIEMASAKLGVANVSISTTGRSIAARSDSELGKLAGSYSLTYDYPMKLGDPFRCNNGYNSFNYAQALRLRRLGISYDIMLPVRSLGTLALTQLACDLAELRPGSIGLLQLMPIGSNSPTLSGDIPSIQDIEVTRKDASKLVRELRRHGYDGKIICNCVIRRYCSAMTGLKIGLDQFGDVYGCLWAANLDVPKERNPFYFGNVLEEPFVDIVSRICCRASTLERSHCFVYGSVCASCL